MYFNQCIGITLLTLAALSVLEEFESFAASALESLEGVGADLLAAVVLRRAVVVL